MTREMRRWTGAKYDSELAHDLYCVGSEQVYAALAPLANIVVLREVYDLGQDEIDYYVSDCVEEMFFSAHKRTYHGDETAGFTRHFAIIARYRLMRSLLANKPQYFDGELPRMSRMIHQRDVENAIYLDQIPNYLQGLALSRIRFEGDDLQACLYVLDRVMTKSMIVLSYMKRFLHVKDPEFYVTYIIALLRIILYELRFKGTHGFYNSLDFRYEFEENI